MTPEEVQKMKNFDLFVHTLICFIPALIVQMAKDFEVLSDEDERRRFPERWKRNHAATEPKP